MGKALTLSLHLLRRDAHALLARVSTLHHLALGTTDVARLAAFYRDWLGLCEVARHNHEDGSLRSVWLSLGHALLMIERTEAAPHHVIGTGAGPFLIAIAVEKTEREPFEQRLLEGGFLIESRSEWTSYLRDPDGNRIAVSTYPLSALV